MQLGLALIVYMQSCRVVNNIQYHTSYNGLTAAFLPEQLGSVRVHGCLCKSARVVAPLQTSPGGQCTCLRPPAAPAWSSARVPAPGPLRELAMGSNDTSRMTPIWHLHSLGAIVMILSMPSPPTTPCFCSSSCPATAHPHPTVHPGRSILKILCVAREARRRDREKGIDVAQMG